MDTNMTPLEQCVPEEKSLEFEYTDEERVLLKQIFGENGDKTPEYWKERMRGWNDCRNEMLRRIAALKEQEQK
jgi:hypothetical protein